MAKLRAIHLISILLVIVIFFVSIVLTSLANYGLFAAVLFSFMNIIGANFLSASGLVDARNPLVLTAVALGGVANIAFTITFTTIFYQILVGVDIRYILTRKSISNISRHVIITPINEMGLELAKKLKANKVPYVFIDENLSVVKKALQRGFTAIHGNPASPETLARARIDKALALYALFDDDIKNTFVTIEARRGAKKTRVISRIKRLEDIPKMERSGARRVILPEAAIGIEIGDFITSNS